MWSWCLFFVAFVWDNFIVLNKGFNFVCLRSPLARSHWSEHQGKHKNAIELCKLVQLSELRRSLRTCMNLVCVFMSYCPHQIFTSHWSWGNVSFSCLTLRLILWRWVFVYSDVMSIWATFCFAISLFLILCTISLTGHEMDCFNVVAALFY